MDADLAFTGSRLDRADFRRRDEAWLRAAADDERTRVLPVWRLSVLVREGPAPRLAWATSALREAAGEDATWVLLGVEDGTAHFALDLSAVEDPVTALEWRGAAGFPELRAVAGQLPHGEAAVAAQARHLIDWHARHRFCPGCGGATRPVEAGWSRRCEASGCGALHFPRTDPVVIMLVTDGERCLLGRQPRWPRPFFSALAGFVEPGETLEEAVRREVREEASVEVGEVRYRRSQPWPFPASLMLGCRARACSRTIRVDAHELEEAAWFSRDEVRAALAGATARLAVPPPLAIAHHLLREWAEEPDGAELLTG
jgi:NAD+ diphosphatase